jgi:pimeloyl-ACP methyl ester carboxylesterase
VVTVSAFGETGAPMGKRVDLNGVDTWYEDRGAGEAVVLLHGGFTDSRDFGGNLERLTSGFRCLFPERRGHGRTPDVEGPISGEIMASDTIQFIERIVGGPVPLIGYSAGAMVALWTAARRPDLVSRLVLISGAFDGDGMMFKPVAGVPMPPPLVTAYGEVSPDGVDHFPIVQAKIARAAAEDPGLTPEDLARITCPALVVSADDDLITLEHTIALYRGLPDGQLAIVPGSSHLLLHEKPEFCVNLVVEFLTRNPVRTLMPIRRASSHRHQSL